MNPDHLLFTLASRPVGDVLTGELVAEEIVRTLVGSIGLVASVPITTGLAALVASQAGPSRRARMTSSRQTASCSGRDMAYRRTARRGP